MLPMPRQIKSDGLRGVVFGARCPLPRLTFFSPHERILFPGMFGTSGLRVMRPQA